MLEGKRGICHLYPPRPPFAKPEAPNIVKRLLARVLHAEHPPELHQPNHTRCILARLDSLTFLGGDLLTRRSKYAWTPDSERRFRADHESPSQSDVRRPVTFPILELVFGDPTRAQAGDTGTTPQPVGQVLGYVARGWVRRS